MKKVLSLLLVVVMILGCMMSLTSCGKSGGTMTLNVGARPDTIDPALNSAVDGATYIVHTFTGLVGYEPDDEGKPVLVAQLAKELPKGEKLEDGKTAYTFELRDDLKWNDGSKLDANDFVYAWNRAADPMTGADYAYMFEVIDGYADVADMYLTSEDAEGNVVFEKDADGNPKYKDGKKALNVTASEDGKKLTVVLTVDVPYFHELCAFPAYLPVKKDVVEANPDSWATKAETYIGNGAYKVTEFSNSQLVLEKNEYYYDVDSVVSDKLIFAFNDDDASLLANFKNGSYLFIDSVPNDEIANLKKEYKDEFYVEGQLGTYYVSFNVNDKAFKDFSEDEKAKIREALGLMIDRNYVAEEIGQAGQVPAAGFVAMGLTEPDGSEYISKNGPEGDGKGYFSVDAADYKANCDAAVKLLEEVAKSSGKFTVADGKVSKDFPVINYITNEGTGHEAVAEYLQQAWGVYGIEVKVEVQEWATFLNTRKEGNYSVARNGWLGDYNDPISFLDMWITDSGNNDSQLGREGHKSYKGYSFDGKDGLTWAESYDACIAKVKAETDPAKRFELMHEAEDILMTTGAICPIYYYTDIFMCDDSLENFFTTPLGFKYFMYASVK
ncbi:MAG: peptide ABC transporter substrate-binding protein [Clostridia bacterium]|nr:peptide ABC transporter substrate-binding protein [Clostridia bacterium]